MGITGIHWGCVHAALFALHVVMLERSESLNLRP